MLKFNTKSVREGPDGDQFSFVQAIKQEYLLVGQI